MFVKTLGINLPAGLHPQGAAAKLLYSALGGIVFLAAFHYGYSQIPDHFYSVRDDGVITLSHAKNWIDYGFIGVNPSGGRVEGYSAPVQLFAYALLYGLLGLSYETFMATQTVTCTFLLGCIISGFFEDHRKIGLIVTALIALVLTNLTSFLEWHGSGMENAITHVLFVYSVYAFLRMARHGTISYLPALLVFLASISRAESIFHIAPLLAVFTIYGFAVLKNDRAFRFSLLVVGLWVLFQLWRVWYFGDLLPNTGYAQGISVMENLRRALLPTIEDQTQWTPYSGLIFLYHGGYLLLGLIGCAIWKDRDAPTVLLAALVMSLALTAHLNPLVFGPTRLDPVRSTTQLALVTAALVPVLVHLTGRSDRLPWRAPVLGAAFLAVTSITRIDPYEACCSVTDFDRYRQQFAAAAAEERLPRPTVSNPDLGVMSWHKQFNIVDLGRLGSPIMAKLADNPVLADYFFDYAAPDMIESHGYWTCRYYDSVFTDPRFKERYAPWGREVSLDDSCVDGTRPTTGMWIRRDILAESGSAERRLIDELQRNLSIQALRDELASCQEQEGTNCAYVARTAFRFLPEFIAAGDHGELVAVFRGSRTSPFDLHLVTGRNNGQSHLAAIDFIRRRHGQSVAGPIDEAPMVAPER